jgi:TPR repeat protein
LKEPVAAFGVGQTYDPAVYAKYKIKGLSADAQQAAEWYGKAAAVGHVAAANAIEALPAQP